VTANVNWPLIWTNVAERLAAHRSAGRGHLLTEDVLRFETVLALQQAGVAPGRLSAEVRLPELLGGALDLVLDAPSGTAIEFKFPRDSARINPDTMTLGELLRDFLRVASVPAEDRWVVQIIGDRLMRYLNGVESRYRLRWFADAGDTLHLHPAVLAGLPKTALEALGKVTPTVPVIARCRVSRRLDEGLAL
jgi:hypothetical protein